MICIYDYIHSFFLLSMSHIRFSETGLNGVSVLLSFLRSVEATQSTQMFESRHEFKVFENELSTCLLFGWDQAEL